MVKTQITDSTISTGNVCILLLAEDFLVVQHLNKIMYKLNFLSAISAGLW